MLVSTHPETLLNESNSTLWNHYRQHFKGHDFQRVCRGGLGSNNWSIFFNFVLLHNMYMFSGGIPLRKRNLQNNTTPYLSIRKMGPPLEALSPPDAFGRCREEPPERDQVNMRHVHLAVRLGRRERRRIEEYTKPTRTRAKWTERTDLYKKHYPLFFCRIQDR